MPPGFNFKHSNLRYEYLSLIIKCFCIEYWIFKFIFVNEIIILHLMQDVNQRIPDEKRKEKEF